MMLYKMQLSSIIHHPFDFEKLSMEREIGTGRGKEHDMAGESADVISVILLETDLSSTA